MATLKLKLLPRSTLQGKVGIKFPASLKGEGGVVVTTAGRDVTIGLNPDTIAVVVGTPILTTFEATLAEAVAGTATGRIMSPLRVKNSIEAGGFNGLFTQVHLYDTDASHDLIVKAGSNLTLDRTLTLATGDADRTLTLTGNATLNQDVSTTASPVFSGVTLNNTGLHLLDTDGSHDLIIAPGSNLTLDRTLTLTLGDVDRTLTMTGNATLNQDVSTAGSPAFKALDLTTSGLSGASYVPIANVSVSESYSSGTGFFLASAIVSTKVGGTGHREALHIEQHSSASAVGEFVVGTNSIGRLTGGSGNVFGSNSYVWVDAGALETAEAAGLEINTDIRRNVVRKAGLMIVDVATSVGTGTTYDAAAIVTTQAGGLGYEVGLQFGSLSGPALKTTGTVLYFATATTIANGINLTAATITGNAFASPGFSVNGAGSLSTQGIAIPVSGGSINFNSGDVTITHSADKLTFAGAANGYQFDTGFNITSANSFIELGAVGSANTPLIDFHSSASSTDFDVRLLATGGTAASGAGTLDVMAASVRFTNITTTASAANAFLDSANGNNILRSTSSRRYKTDIAEMTALQANKVLKLQPVTYRSTAVADDSQRIFYGLVAEDVAEVDSSLVHYLDGEPDGVMYDRLGVLLLAKVKELSGRLASIEHHWHSS